MENEFFFFDLVNDNNWLVGSIFFVIKLLKVLNGNLELILIVVFLNKLVCIILIDGILLFMGKEE